MSILGVFEGPVCATSGRRRGQATSKSRGAGPTLLPSFESCGCFSGVYEMGPSLRLTWLAFLAEESQVVAALAEESLVVL